MTALFRNFDLSDAAVITGALLVVIGVALVNLAAAMIVAGLALGVGGVMFAAKPQGGK
jgi:hypothetical protein